MTKVMINMRFLLPVSPSVLEAAGRERARASGAGRVRGLQRPCRGSGTSNWTSEGPVRGPPSCPSRWVRRAAIGPLRSHATARDMEEQS
jgi:hypothetical protein